MYLESYREFCGILDSVLSKCVQDNNIIIYGWNRGGDFIKWYLKKKYGKNSKAVIDRWGVSEGETVLHLWSLYYIYDHKDIILNCTPKNIIDEFNDTQEKWEDISYKESQIVNIFSIVYPTIGDKDDNICITYFDWLQVRYGVDLLPTIKRANIKGNGVHGYAPTEFRIYADGLDGYDITTLDKVLDIGSGKGGGVLALLNYGFHKVGAIEYSEEIYHIMKNNVEGVGIDANKLDLLKGDASSFSTELDEYNWYFLFNPFTLDVFEKVFQNIIESLDRAPRGVRIFYVEPIGHSIIMKSGKFKLEKMIKENYAECTYYAYIYRSL